MSTKLADAAARVALRIEEVAASIGVSSRALRREISAGTFPPPDRKIGRMPLWARSTVEAWIAAGNAKPKSLRISEGRKRA